MASSCTTSVESSAIPSCQWRRDSENVQEKPFSEKSSEFIPKSFSAQSREFVPSWKKAKEEVVPASSHASDSITGSGTSADDSSDKELVLDSLTEKSPEFVPKSFSAKSREFVPSWRRGQDVSSIEFCPGVFGGGGPGSLQIKPFSSKSKEFVPKTFSAKAFSAKAPEFVSKSLSAKSAEVPEAHIPAAQSPKTAKLSSPRTPSTCVGSSPSLCLSTDDESPIASVSGSSRSVSPPPVASEASLESAAAPLSVHALLQWRHATSSERPIGQLPAAAEPEPETPQEAAAVAAREGAMLMTAAAPQDDAAPLSVHDFFKKPTRRLRNHATVVKLGDESTDAATAEEAPATSALEAVRPTDLAPAAAATAEEAAAVPAAPEAAPPTVPAPLSMHALLQWRHATPSERPAARLPAAAEPEPDTPEAAAAAAAKAAAIYVPASALTEDACSPSLERIEDTTPQHHSKELSAEAPSGQEKSRREVGDKSWRNVDPVKKLKVSELSWAAQQQARRSTRSGSDSENLSDKDVVRAMKSILNKLTVEKFDSLSAQIMQCGITTATHLEKLIDEVFEKATTQHHFIDMYADLCALLNQHRIIEDPKINFKKILLNCCQASFEKNLTPPAGLSELSSEDRMAAELMYKMRMIGNIRFVGALLVRKMLASKVMLSIMEVLLQDPTPEALESLAAFLMVVGPSFDTPDWAYRATLNAVFAQIGKLVKKPSIPSRIQCLLKDVIDVRTLGWQDRRPKKIEGPLKLNQVAAKAAIENGGGVWDTSRQSSNGDGWEVVGGAGKATSIFHMSTPTKEAVKITKEADLFKKARDRQAKQEAKQESLKKEKKEKKEAKREPAAFDKEACRKALSSTLAELRVSHDVPDAIARVADIGVPVSHQASELCWMLAYSAEEGSQEVRKLGFGLVVGLFLAHHWTPESAAKGIRCFVEDTCADLKQDVPTLPEILRSELHPALAPLLTSNVLDVDLHDSLKIIS